MSGPKRIPIFSSQLTICCLAYFLVPLKHMCSMKCARPCWSSSSSTEPALTASHSWARLAGLAFLST